MTSTNDRLGPGGPESGHITPIPDLPPLPQTGSAGEESRDPLWYQRAVFYEVLIRGFADSNGDGTGDRAG